MTKNGYILFVGVAPCTYSTYVYEYQKQEQELELAPEPDPGPNPNPNPAPDPVPHLVQGKDPAGPSCCCCSSNRPSPLLMGQGISRSDILPIRSAIRYPVDLKPIRTIHDSIKEERT